jgi:hypothetical protein
VTAAPSRWGHPDIRAVGGQGRFPRTTSHFDGLARPHPGRRSGLTPSSRIPRSTTACCGRPLHQTDMSFSMDTAASEHGLKLRAEPTPPPVLSATRCFAFRAAGHIAPCSLAIQAKNKDLAGAAKSLSFHARPRRARSPCLCGEGSPPSPGHPCGLCAEREADYLSGI